MAFAMLCPRTCSRRGQTSGGGIQFPTLESRPEEIGDDVPGGFGIFGTIVRSFTRSAFAPAGNVVVCVEFGEEDAAFGDAIHRGFEWGEEREMDFA